MRETYSCAFVSDEVWGEPALPKRAMKWDCAGTEGLEDETIPGLTGPYRWFSNVEDLLTNDLCWMYTTGWRIVITRSGNVNAKVVYDPPVFEGPDCPKESVSRLRIGKRRASAWAGVRARPDADAPCHAHRRAARGSWQPWTTSPGI